MTDAMTSENPTPSEMLERITSALDSGKEVQLCNMLRVTRITPRQHEKWKRDGLQMFRILKDGALAIRSGNGWNRFYTKNVSLCAIHIID